MEPEKIVLKILRIEALSIDTSAHVLPDGRVGHE